MKQGILMYKDAVVFDQFMITIIRPFADKGSCLPLITVADRTLYVRGDNIIILVIMLACSLSFCCASFRFIFRFAVVRQIYM